MRAANHGRKMLSCCPVMPASLAASSSVFISSGVRLDDSGVGRREAVLRDQRHHLGRQLFRIRGGQFEPELPGFLHRGFDPGRLPHCVGLQQVDGAKQVDGGVGVLHGPHGGLGKRRRADCGSRDHGGRDRAAHAASDRGNKGLGRLSSCLSWGGLVLVSPRRQLVSGFGIVGREDRLDGQLEKTGDREGERQGGIVAAGLDRVDGLPGHFEFLRKVRLAPGALGSRERAAGSSCGPPFFARALPAIVAVTIEADTICTKKITTKAAPASSGETSPCTSATDQTKAVVVNITADTA